MYNLDPFVFDELKKNIKKGKVVDNTDSFDSSIVKTWLNIGREAAKHDRSINLPVQLSLIHHHFQFNVPSLYNSSTSLLSGSKESIVIPRTNSKPCF
jgi:hypothetical protein